MTGECVLSHVNTMAAYRHAVVEKLPTLITVFPTVIIVTHCDISLLPTVLSLLPTMIYRYHCSLLPQFAEIRLFCRMRISSSLGLITLQVPYFNPCHSWLGIFDSHAISRQVHQMTPK